jgi:hypothetical protein
VNQPQSAKTTEQYRKCFLDDLSTTRPLGDRRAHGDGSERRAEYDYETHRRDADRLLVKEPLETVAANLARIVRKLDKEPKGHVLWSDLVYHLRHTSNQERRFEITTSIAAAHGVATRIERLFQRLETDENFKFLSASARTFWAECQVKPPVVTDPVSEVKPKTRGGRKQPRGCL